MQEFLIEVQGPKNAAKSKIAAPSMRAALSALFANPDESFDRLDVFSFTIRRLGDDRATAAAKEAARLLSTYGQQVSDADRLKVADEAYKLLAGAID